MKIEKTFCTTREAADLLGVSVGTTQLWVESGLLAAWKTAGGHRRVMRDSVQNLLRVKTSPPPAVASASQRLKIVVLEDDQSLLRLYQTMMAQWPMAPQVFAIDNGIEALLTIEQEHPDLLVTDLNMSGTDGFKMLHILKNRPGHSHMDIVVVSGLDATDIANRGGLPEGITVLPKPIPFAKLLTIAKSVDTKRVNRQAAHAAP